MFSWQGGGWYDWLSGLIRFDLLLVFKQLKLFMCQVEGCSASLLALSCSLSRVNRYISNLFDRQIILRLSALQLKTKWNRLETEILVLIWDFLVYQKQKSFVDLVKSFALLMKHIYHFLHSTTWLSSKFIYVFILYIVGTSVVCFMVVRVSSTQLPTRLVQPSVDPRTLTWLDLKFDIILVYLAHWMSP